LKRTSTALGFLFFIFNLEYLIRVQSYDPFHAKVNPTSCLFGSRFASAQTAIFPPNRAPKLFFGLQLVSNEFQHPAMQTKTEQHFGGFFSQIKVCQTIGRQDSMQTVILASRTKPCFKNVLWITARE
jgi:hypothetical protein